MSKLFVISEIGFEYNDEIYAQTENGGGEPIKAYRTEEKAESAALELNLAKLKELLEGEAYSGDGLDAYAYRLDEIISSKDEIKVCKILGIEEQKFEEIEAFMNAVKDANDDQLTKILDLMQIGFYEVNEIEFVED